MAPAPPRVAVDVTPLAAGVHTGIARFVGQVATLPGTVAFTLSLRARSAPPWRRLPGSGDAAVARWAAGRRRPGDTWPTRGCAVVHGTNFVAPPPRRGQGVVLTVHDATPFERPDWVEPHVRPFAEVVRRRVAEGAWVHTPSEHVAALVRALLGTDRVVAVHHGPPRPVPGGRPPGVLDAFAGRRLVVAVGLGGPRKDAPTLAAAVRILRSRPATADVVLVVVGSGGDAVTDAVALGNLDDAARDAVLRAASVLAYPSLDEGFGLPILEAQAAGLPVVATTAGAIPEVAGAGARLVPPGDPEVLADALAAVLADPGPLVAAGTANLDRFSWDATLTGIAGLYARAAVDT
jgi:glycosyltransferase involved in cell wall biosynthesis